MASRPYRALLALACAAEFVVVLDVSIVNVALPSIDAALGLGPDGLPWVVNAYALAFGGFLLLGGRLADVVGPRATFTAGLALFTGASLLGGLAPSAGTLVAARALQGLGAALLAPATLTILTAHFPEGPERTRALALWTAVAVVGGAAGNVIGGALTELVSWRAILLVNVPLGVAGVLAGRAVLARRDAAAGTAGGTVGADGRAPRRPRLDVPGATLATAGLLALTYGLGDDAARAPALAAAVVLLALFALRQRRATDPLVPPALLRLRSVAVGNVATILAAAALVPMWYFLTLTMQRTLGYGPLETGLAFLPHTLGTALVAVRLTPALMQRMDARVLIGAGAVVLAAGFAWQSRVTAASGYVEGILGPAVLLALGGGVLTTPLTRAVTEGVAAGSQGAASGVLNVAKQVGGAVGLAVLAAAVAGDLAAAFAVMAVLCLATGAVALALPPSRDAAVGAEPTPRRRGGANGRGRG